MVEYTVQQYRDAARRAYEAGNMAAAEELAQAGLALQASQAPRVGVAEDVARSLVGGLQRGVTGLADLGYEGLGLSDRYAATGTVDTITPESIGIVRRAGGEYGAATRAAEALHPSYEPQTFAGKIAGTSAEFAPTALAFGPAGVLRRLAYGAVAPAVGSEVAGAMTEGEPIEPYARFVGSLAAPLALGLGEGAVRSLISPTGGANPEILASARVLSDKYGVQTTAGMATGDRTLLAREGATRAGERMQNEVFEQWTEAVLRQAGIPAKSATPQVIDDAFTAAGNKLDDLVARTDVLVDQNLIDDLAQLVDDFYANGGVGTKPKALLEQIMEIATGRSGKTVTLPAGNSMPALSGEAYQEIMSGLGRSRRVGGQIGQFAADAMDAIRSAVGSSLSASGKTQLLDEWNAANRLYANIVPIAEASRYAKGGQFTPSQLMSALANQSRRNVQRGRGDLAELAKAGYDVLQRTASSGTSERLIAAGAGGAGPAGAGAAFGAASGDISTAGQAALAGGLMAPLRNRFAQSWFGQNIYYPNQLLSPIPRGTGERGMMSAIPQATAGLLSQRSSAQ